MDENSKHYVTVQGVPVNCSQENLLHQMQNHVAPNSISGIQQLYSGIESDHSLRWIIRLQTLEDVNYLCDNIKSLDVVVEGERHIVTYSRPLQWEIPSDWEKNENNMMEQIMPGPTPHIGSRDTANTNAQGIQQLLTGKQRWIGPLGMQSGFYHNLDSSAQIPLDQNAQEKLQAQHFPHSNLPSDFMSKQVGHPFLNQRNSTPESLDQHYYGVQGNPKGYTYHWPPPQFHGANVPPLAHEHQKNKFAGRNEIQQVIKFEQTIPVHNQDYQHMHQFGRPNYPFPNQQYPTYPNIQHPQPPIQIPQQNQTRLNANGMTMPYGGAFNEGHCDNQQVPNNRQAVNDIPRYQTRLPKEDKTSYTAVSINASALDDNNDDTRKKIPVGSSCEQEENTREAEVSFKDMEQVDCEKDENDENEKMRKIIVRNLPSEVTEEFLTLFFENKNRYGGGDIHHLEFDCENSSAVVEFEDAESVDRVLSKRPIVMMDETIEVVEYMSEPEEPDELCTIEVTGPRSIICEENIETLEMYFDNTKRSGGEDVVNCKYCPDKGMVLITFKSEKVARRVVNRPEHRIKRETLSVSLHFPDSNATKSMPEKTELDKAQDTICTVKVTGLKQFTSRESVTLYFENAERSNGGEVKDIKYDEQNIDIAYFTFAEGEVAKRVCERTHMADGKIIHVSLFQLPKPSPIYNDRVILHGLQSSTTKDCLFNFLEAKSGSIPSQLIFHAEQEDTAMVTFQDAPDMNKLEEALTLNKLEGVFLKMSRAPVSNCILVTSLPKEVSEDDIELYFENARRSGGGPVDKITIDDGDDFCFVYFKDFQVIPSVLRKKHTINGHIVQVQIYQDCLGRPEGELTERKLRMPDPITMKDCDNYKIKYLSYSAASKHTLELQLKDCFTSTRWTEDRKDIILVCTLTKAVENCHKLAKEWPQNAEQTFNDFMKSIEVYKTTVLQEIWDKVAAEMRNISISNPEAVAVIQDRRDSSINVVGLPDCAKEVSNKVENITRQILAEMEEERQTIKEVITTLNQIDMKLLLADKVPRKIEEIFKGVKVKINLDHNQIIFEGQAAKVREAKLKMYEIKNAFSYRCKTGVQTITGELLLGKEIKQHIVKKLKAGKITAVWEVEKGSLQVCCTSEMNSDESVSIIVNSVLENTIGLKKESLSLINSDLWQTRMIEIHQMYPGKCRVCVADDQTRVHVCGTDDIFFTVLDTVKNFIRLNTVYVIKVPCTKIVHRLIERHHKEDITKIPKELQNFHVQVTFLEELRCFELRGTEDGFEEAKKRLLGLLSKVKWREHEVDQPGLNEHMQTPKGREILNKIENTVKCAVTVKSIHEKDEEYKYNVYDSDPGDNAVSTNIESAPKVPSSMPLQRSKKLHEEVGLAEVSNVKVGNVTVSLINGEIAKQQANVIVNTTAKNLDLTKGAVSASLLQAAGPELQNELHTKYPNGLKDGELAVTSGQKLKCSMIFHCTLDAWDKQNPDRSKQALQKLMKVCMAEAEKNKFVSIAFPAIGTGNLGFPRDVVATEMLSTVSTFAAASLKEVHFIVYQKDLPTIKEFEAEITKWESEKRVCIRHDPMYNPHDDHRSYFIQETANEENVEGEHIYDRLSILEEKDDDDDDEDSCNEDDLITSKEYDTIDDQEYKIGNMSVKIQQGDITTDPSECIVNSSNEALDLTKGAVSRAILEKGGKALADELKKLSKQMKKEHIVMSSAPGLPCKFIMHVVAVDTGREWKQTVRKCLDMAEQVHLSSIAFPALGTGLKTKAEEIARIIMDVVADFDTTQPQIMTDIKIVIFQQSMVAKFHRVFRGDARKNSKRTFSGMLRQVAGYVAGKSKQQEPIRSIQKIRRNKQNSGNTTTFLIFSLSESVNDQAVRKLESILDKEVHRKEFKDTIIMKLDANQMLGVQAIVSKYHLDFKLDKSIGIIEVSGIATNVIEASDQIHGILRDAVTIEQQKSAADLLTNLVQWHFMDRKDKGQKLIPYDKDLNYTIEAGFKSQAPDVTFTQRGEVYKLDFANMVEFPVNNTKDTVAVIRKGFVTLGAFENPTTWADMTGNIRVVALTNTDAEYQDISNKFLASAGGNFTISKIERIQNNTLWQQYQAKKKQLDDKNPPNTKNEQLLWHGTAPEAVDNINFHGFNRSYCGKNATAYGDGVYFAVNASYSCSHTYSRPDTFGMKRIYHCRVLTGEFAPGQFGMRVPPQKPGGSPTDLYDSVSGPSMFIIFHDTQAYPEYLITFK